MHAFEFSTTAKIVFGEPVASALLAHCQQHKLFRLSVITDRQIVALGLLDSVLAVLEENGIAVQVFKDVEPDPSTATVLEASRQIQQHQSDGVIGFGGGSSLDVAKVTAVLANPGCQQKLEHLYGINQITEPRLGLVLVPTTAGTGSEVTPIAILTTGEQTKSGIVSAVLLPDCALLDPSLTLGLPPAITAATGIDAMVHGIEAYTSKIKKNPLSDGLARNALRLLSGNISSAVHDGKNLAARGAMLLGSLLAGQAFANAPVGGVHALAYPLGGIFHIPHGLSNALMLPHVLKFNLPAAQQHYAELAPIVCTDLPAEGSELEYATHFIAYLTRLIGELGLPTKLRDCGVDEGSLAMLAEQAMQQQRLLVNNPVSISEDDALALYQQAY